MIITLTALSHKGGGTDWSFDGKSGDVCTKGLQRMLGVVWEPGAKVHFQVDQPPAPGGLLCTWSEANYTPLLNGVQVTDSVGAALRKAGVNLAEPFSITIPREETLTFVRDHSDPELDWDLGWEGPQGEVICMSHAERLFGWNPNVDPGTQHTLVVSCTPVDGAVHIRVRESDRCLAIINGMGVTVWRDLRQLVLDKGGEVWVRPA